MAAKRSGSISDSALSPQTRSARGHPAYWFRRSAGWKRPPYGLIGKHHPGVRVKASAFRPITPLPQPRSAISPSIFAGRCSRKKRAQYPGRCGRTRWRGCESSTAYRPAAAVGLRRIGHLRRGKGTENQPRLFHASDVVVVPRIFSNSARVELDIRAFAAAMMRVSGDNLAQRAQLLLQQPAASEP